MNAAIIARSTGEERKSHAKKRIARQRRKPLAGRRPLVVYTRLVYTGSMLKNITFSADENLIREARRQAALHNTTLNEFREWLAAYVAEDQAEREERVRQYQELMARLGLRFDRKYTREEMNERW